MMVVACCKSGILPRGGKKKKKKKGGGELQEAGDAVSRDKQVHARDVFVHAFVLMHNVWKYIVSS
jgi:hypothetical protein